MNFQKIKFVFITAFCVINGLEIKIPQDDDYQNKGAYLPTTLPDPCIDVEYFTFDDDTRNVNYGNADLFCDNDGSGHFYTSPDWHGPNW